MEKGKSFMLYRHQDKDFLAYPPSYRLRASDKPFAPSGHRLRTKLRTRWKIFILKTILQKLISILRTINGDQTVHQDMAIYALAKKIVTITNRNNSLTVWIP